MRKIIIGLAALVLLGGGGAGAYFYFMPPAEASGGDEAHKEAAKKEDHGEEGKDKEVEFVELDPLILPIVDKEGVNQVVSLVIAIEVTGTASVDKVKKMSPRLKDAYIQDMYGVFNEHAALKGGVIQVGQIKKRLNVITEHVLGEGVSNDVLLQVVQQRPI